MVALPGLRPSPPGHRTDADVKAIVARAAASYSTQRGTPPSAPSVGARVAKPRSTISFAGAIPGERSGQAGHRGGSFIHHSGAHPTRARRPRRPAPHRARPGTLHRMAGSTRHVRPLRPGIHPQQRRHHLPPVTTRSSIRQRHPAADTCPVPSDPLTEVNPGAGTRKHHGTELSLSSPRTQHPGGLTPQPDHGHAQSLYEASFLQDVVSITRLAVQSHSNERLTHAACRCREPSPVGFAAIPCPPAGLLLFTFRKQGPRDSQKSTRCHFNFRDFQC